MRHLFLCSVLLISSFIFTTPAFATNLLQNSDFESANVDPWVTSGGGAVATTSAELIHSGNYSLKVQHDKTSTYGFQQTVQNIEGEKYYRITGYAATNNNNVASYFMRLGWYNNEGNQFSTSDTNEVTQIDNNWTAIQETFQAPSSAQSVKVRLVLKSKTSGATAFVYFDDIIFEQVAAPTPTDSPISTPTPTKTPTPTPKPTNTPTPKPSPTPTPRKTPTPTGRGPKASSSSVSVPSSILGTSSSATPTQIESPLKNLVIFGGGLVFILSGTLLATFIRKH